MTADQRLSKPLFGLILASLLSACMPTADEPPAIQAPPPQPTETRENVPPVLPPPPPEPSRLEGLNPRQVMDLMGEPALMRRDGPIQVMLFEIHDCVFEVVFSEPSLDAYFEVTHITARDRNGNSTNVQACLIKILPDGNWPDL